MKFNENTFGGSRVVACGLADTTKEILDFRKFANGPNKATKTPVKFVTIRKISSTHCGVLRLLKSSENRKFFTSSFGCLKLLFEQDEQNTDHETELVGNDGNYFGFYFESDRFECQPKH